jgi:hypothetical protein
MIEAESYGFEGIVFTGSLFPFKKVAEAFGKKRPADADPPAIVPLDREVDESFHMSPKMWAEFFNKAIHSVDSDLWYYLMNRSADIYGNTGRPNKRPWINMTQDKLLDGNVFVLFKHIYFRPKDVSPIQSKGEAIAQLREHYDHVTHYDVDPWVVFGLAKVFPDVSFTLVETLHSGLFVSRAEMNRFPNVRRVAQLEHEAL